MFYISKVISAVKVETLHLANFHQLAHAICTEKWCPGLFQSKEKLIDQGLALSNSVSNRRNEFFLGAPSIFAVDIDEGLGMAEAKERLEEANLSYLIAPSRNHLKVKEGHEALGATVERFRIVLFLKTPIENMAAYKATFKYVKEKLFPEMDKQCSDPARFYYPSTGIAYFNFSLGTLSPVTIDVTPAAAPAQLAPPISTQAGTATSLPKRRPKYVSDFYVDGIAHLVGGRNNLLLKVCQWHVKEQKLGEAELYEKVAPIALQGGLTDTEIRATVASSMNTRVEFTLAEEPNRALYELLLSSWLILDLHNPSSLAYIYNDQLAPGTPMQKIDPSIVMRLFSPETQKLIKSRITAAVTVYKPFEQWVFKPAQPPVTALNELNVYAHPQWRTFPTEAKQLPELYERFFKHLVKDDEPSYEYLLDWVANALVSRNYTILCAIASEEGTGKGVFAAILENLFGVENFNKVRDEVFKNKFNAGLRHKRLIHLDEVKLRNDEEMNRFKDVINNKIEIEQKGKDAMLVENYASYYLSSNNLDAVRPSASDRRFSIIEMANEKLVTKFSAAEIEALVTGADLQQLGSALLNRRIKNNMMLPFKATHYLEVKEAAMPAWQAWMLEEFSEDFLNKEVLWTDFKEHMAQAIGRNYLPGRAKVRKFIEEERPECFKMKQKANGVRVIIPVRPESTEPQQQQLTSTHTLIESLLKPTQGPLT